MKIQFMLFSDIQQRNKGGIKMDKRFYPKQDFVDLEKDHMEKNDLTLTVGIDNSM